MARGASQWGPILRFKLALSWLPCPRTLPGVLSSSPHHRPCRHQAVRIRQVADPAVGSMPAAISKIVAESGWGKLYEGLPSILFRQISFGMMKFLVFDFFTGKPLGHPCLLTSACPFCALSVADSPPLPRHHRPLS